MPLETLTGDVTSLFVSLFVSLFASLFVSLSLSLSLKWTHEGEPPFKERMGERGERKGWRVVLWVCVSFFYYSD